MSTRAAPLVAILIVAAAPHIPFLTGGCITDDAVHLARLEAASWREAVAQADAFGFYRPLQQASYAADAALAGYECGAIFRLTNLALHLAVAGSVFAMASLLLHSTPLASAAALMFVLAPKASSIVVFWISARAEALMTLFAVIAAIGWIKWIRGAHGAWLGAAAIAYALSLLGKETSILLPAALLFVPGALRSRSQRAAGIAAIGVAGAIVAVLHLLVIPLGQTLEDGTYAWNVTRLLRGLHSYTGRAIVAPALVLAVMAVSAKALPRLARREGPAPGVAIFGVAWFIALIAPALPIVLRSEVRLYAPSIGLTLAGAALASRLATTPRGFAIALACASLVLGSYQAARSFAEGRAARFSRALVAALRADRALGMYDGPIVLAAADATTDRLMRNGVGGYGPLVVTRALRPGAPPAWPQPAMSADDVLTVRCLARGRDVMLTIER